jgi:hypothetical protein
LLRTGEGSYLFCWRMKGKLIEGHQCLRRA